MCPPPSGPKCLFRHLDGSNEEGGHRGGHKSKGTFPISPYLLIVDSQSKEEEEEEEKEKCG